MMAFMTLFQVLLGLVANRVGILAFLRRRQVNAFAACLGKTDRNRLLRRSSAVLTFLDVFELFAYEFAGLGGRGLSFLLVLHRSTQCFFVIFAMRHGLASLQI